MGKIKLAAYTTTAVGLSLVAAFNLGRESDRSPEQQALAFDTEVAKQVDASIHGGRFSAFRLDMLKITPDLAGIDGAAMNLEAQLGGPSPRNTALAQCAITAANGKFSFRPDEAAPIRRQARELTANYSFASPASVPPLGLAEACRKINHELLESPAFVPMPLGTNG